MPIVDEYDAIARRLRELEGRRPAPDKAKGGGQIGDIEKWRDLARETARQYVEDRRRQITHQLLRRGRS
jgi:hypothetical protein